MAAKKTSNVKAKKAGVGSTTSKSAKSAKAVKKTTSSAASKAATKKSVTKKAVASKAPAKKSVAKKSTVKKTTAKPIAKAVAKKNSTSKGKTPPPKKSQSVSVSPKKGLMKKVAPKAKTPVAKKAVSKVSAPKKAAPKKAEPKKVAPKTTEEKALVAVTIPSLSAGKPTKAIVLSRGANAPRRPKKPSGRATPKLEPRVKKDNSKNEAMFERTQSAPTISAPKVTEFFQTSAYSTPEPVKPKANIRYSEKDLKMFRKLLESEKEKTLDELRMLKERLEDLTNYEASEETAVYSMHMAEQGSEAVEREKTYAQIQRTTDYLRKLEDALIRVDEKTYGICRQCGILIAKERLLAVPITTLSASWKLRQQCPVDGVDRIGK